MAGYQQSSFLRVDGRDRVEVRKYAEERTRAISSHLDQISLVDRGFIILKEYFFSGGSQQLLPDSESQRTIQFILPCRGASPMINCKPSFTAGESRIHVALLINVLTTLFWHLDCQSSGTVIYLFLVMFPSLFPLFAKFSQRRPLLFVFTVHSLAGQNFSP